MSFRAQLLNRGLQEFFLDSNLSATLVDVLSRPTQTRPRHENCTIYRASQKCALNASLQVYTSLHVYTSLESDSLVIAADCCVHVIIQP